MVGTASVEKTHAAHSLGLLVRRSVLIIVSILVAGLGGLVAVLLLRSPGRPNPVVDETGQPMVGSLSEKSYVTINGVEQGMFIRSQDTTKPVLLVLHGGPGMPTYFLTERYPVDLEQLFTVVWWEQRGTGLSYRPDLPPETMTVEQMIADTHAVTNYLRYRFGQDKIYLMGHSWGTFIGIQAAARRPELYHAYIAMAQLTYQLKSEKLAYDYMLQQFQANGNTNMVRKLQGAPVTLDAPLPAAYDALRDDAMHSLGIGTTHDMGSVYTGIFLPSWLSPRYTVREKWNLWRGKFWSKSILWREVVATDLTQKVTRLDVPIYIFQGAYDYTANYSLARAYLEQLHAPLKGFYTFEHSAHSPVLEEPEKALRILREDVLQGTNNLADA